MNRGTKELDVTNARSKTRKQFHPLVQAPGQTRYSSWRKVPGSKKKSPFDRSWEPAVIFSDKLSRERAEASARVSEPTQLYADPPESYDLKNGNKR